MSDLVTDVVTQPELRLWPSVAPGSEDWSHQEYAEIQEDTGWYFVHNVVTPTLTPVLPEPGSANGSAMIVAPGGAYVALAWDHEGLETARWLAARGITAFVLKYRLLEEPDPSVLAEAPPMTDVPAFSEWMKQKTAPTRKLAGQDGQQAVRLLRERADEWGLDRERIGILGFSAGGSTALETAIAEDPHARPDIVVSVYNGFFDGPVPAHVPPLFGVVAADDPLVGRLIEVARMWTAVGAPTEIHVYEQGGHGFSVKPQGLPVDSWPERLADWLAHRGWLPIT